MPKLTHDGTTISEALAIHQFIAETWKPSLLGNTDAEKEKVTVMANHILNLKLALTEPQYQSESKEEALTKLPDLLPNIIKSQEEKRYLCTDEEPTWVDFCFFEILQMVRWLSDG